MTRFIRNTFFILALAAIPQAASAQAKAMTLKECFELALRRSETVQIAQQDIVQARAIYMQALGNALPRLSAHYSELLQDTAPTADSTSVGGTFTRFRRPEVAIRVTQPIFGGFAEFSAMRGAKALGNQHRFNVENAKRLLFADVAQVFYQIAQIEQDIRTTQRILDVLRSETTDLRGRVELGKNRSGELARQEAQLYFEEAEIERMRGEKKVAYSLLSFLTGLDPQPPIRVEVPGGALKAMSHYVSNSSSRPDVLAARQAIDVARGQLGVVRGNLYPHAGVEANYYPYRVGFQQDIKWDALFTVDVPLFNLTTFGEIKEAKSQKKQAELRATATARDAEKDIKQAYDAAVASQSELSRYTTAARKAEESFRFSREDYQNGLVSSLELLEAQQSYIVALRSLNAVRMKNYLNRINLQLEAGIFP